MFTRAKVVRLPALAAMGDDPESPVRVATLAQGLQELGWVVGRNVRIDYRWGGGDFERYRTHAAELAALAPDVILVSGSTIMGPLQQMTRTVPIVFVNVTDPVGAGFVESLARPGGNATGFMLLEYGMSGNVPVRVANWRALPIEIVSTPPSERYQARHLS